MHPSQPSNCSFTFPECRKVWNSAGSSVQVDALGCHRRLPCNTLSFNCNQNSLHHVLDKVLFVHMYVWDEVMTVKIQLGKTCLKTSVQLVLDSGVLTTLWWMDTLVLRLRLTQFLNFLSALIWFTNHLNYQKVQRGIDKIKYDIALLRVVCELGTKAKDLSGKNMLMT